MRLRTKTLQFLASGFRLRPADAVVRPCLEHDHNIPPRREGQNRLIGTGENTNDGRRTCQRAVTELRCLLLAIRTSMSGALRSIRCLIAIQSAGSC